MSHFMSQSTQQDPDVLFVCLLGVGVVFVGLVALIAIVSLTNALLSSIDKSAKNTSESNKNAVQTSTNTPATTTKPIENRQEILAAVCAAVAEENGTDISAIRVISFKKL